MSHARLRFYRNSHGTLAEFAPVLLIICTLLLFALSILSLCAGYGSLVYGCQLAAREAASSPNFTTARDHVNRIRDTVVNGAFGRFGGVRAPSNGQGLTLDVFQLVDGQSQPIPFAPGGAVNTANSYQYRVRANFNLRPLFWPMDVPATTESVAVVEHPEGLALVN